MEISNSIEFTKILLLVSLLMFCSATDVGTRRIPNAALLPALMTALFLNSLAGGLAGFANSLAGLVIGLLMLMPLHVFGRMGAGDIKLLGVVGSILGAWGAVVAALATMMAGAVLGVAYLMWMFIKPDVMARMSRLTEFFTRRPPPPEHDTVPLQTLRAAEIPYALAIAAGTVATLFYLDLLKGVSVT